MQEIQLEFAFDVAVKDAIAHPEIASLTKLWQELEQALTAFPEEQQLQIVGEAIALITDVYASRSEYLLMQWEDTYDTNQSEPLLTLDMLSGFIRQTMTLNLDEILEQPNPQHRASRPAISEPIESVMGQVDKAALLKMVDELDVQSAKEQALAVAHDEDVSTWSRAIAQWMRQQNMDVFQLMQIQHELDMPLVKIWLALLLSGFSLEQRGCFYDAETIWVREP